MSNTNPLGTRYQFASREDRLASDIIAGIETVRRMSDGKYQELVALLAVARLTSNTARIRTSPLPQLQATWALLQGFIDDANSSRTIQLPSRCRPNLPANINGAAATYATAVPFTLARADGVVQDCLVTHNAQPDVVLATWLPANQTGTPSNTAVMWATPNVALATDLGILTVTKLTDSSAIVRVRGSVAADNRIYTVTLTAAGVIQSTLLLDLTTALAGATAAALRDYTDGTVYWCVTMDAAGAGRLHRIQLDAPVATDYQRFTGMTAHASQEHHAVVFAYGDSWSFIARKTGAGLYHVVGTLAEGGATPAAIAIDAVTVTMLLPTQNAIATGLTNTLVSAPIASETGGSPYKFRLFLHPAVVATDGMAVVTIDKTAGATAALQTTIDYTQPSLVDVIDVSPSAGARDIVVSADHRTILAVDDVGNMAAVYDVEAGAQTQVLATDMWLTAFLNSSDCFVNEPLALVTFAGATRLVEIGL